MIEIWKAVPGYDGMYEVSDAGRVRSLPGGKRKGIVLRPSIPKDPTKYMHVKLCKDKQTTTYGIHVLVAIAFLPSRDVTTHQVRHFDGNCRNNVSSNLLWGSAQDNADDRERHGTTVRAERHGMFGRDHLKGVAHPIAKLNDESVRNIRSLSEQGISQRKIAATYSVSQGTIWQILKGNYWAHVE